MGMQLTIEPFLMESFTDRVKTKVRRIAKQIRNFIYPEQLEIIFPVFNDPYVERWKSQLSDGTWVWRERRLDFKAKKTGVVGSPIPMRKIKKDTPYLEGI